jgi:hypothetical protein
MKNSRSVYKRILKRFKRKLVSLIYWMEVFLDNGLDLEEILSAPIVIKIII